MSELSRSNSLADLAARIRIEHEAAAAALKDGAQHAMAAGDLLLEAKSLLKHGEWLPWLQAHFNISERTARLYMRLARHRETIQNGNGVAEMSLRGALAMITIPMVSKDELVTGWLDKSPTAHPTNSTSPPIMPPRKPTKFARPLGARPRRYLRASSILETISKTARYTTR